MTTKIKHLYIHVPFCKTICSYCDFCHEVYKEDVADKWLNRLAKDFKRINNEEYETIYIGGGTPSSLSIDQLKKLLELIKPFSNKVIEYTFEVNPESINEDKILLLKEYGINRVSIGLQSSSDKLLKLMNRHHNFNDVKNTIELFRRHQIDNISLDIIYSLPTQTMEDLRNTLDDVLSLNVPHISLYSLTIEKGTIFDRLGYKTLDEDVEADMYEYIEKEFIKHDYVHYEIANFAKEGYESKHNLGYWNYDDYRGISCGATGKYDHKRFVETRDIRKYINEDETVEIEEIPLKEEAFENIIMSLRTIHGLDIKLFNERYGIDFIKEYKSAIENNKDNLLFDNDYCKCKNLEILNSILLDFMQY